VRVAADDAAQTDDRRVLAALREALRDRRNLERAGHANDVDRVVRDAVAFQPVEGAGDEIVDNGRVEARRHHGEATRRRGERAFDDGGHIPSMLKISTRTRTASPQREARASGTVRSPLLRAAGSRRLLRLLR